MSTRYEVLIYAFPGSLTGCKYDCSDKKEIDQVIEESYSKYGCNGPVIINEYEYDLDDPITIPLDDDPITIPLEPSICSLDTINRIYEKLGFLPSTNMS